MTRWLALGVLAIFGAGPALADTINRRNDCDHWEYIPASETLGSPPTALLFCNQAEQKWLALRVNCDLENLQMQVQYQPGYDFIPPRIASRHDDGATGNSLLSAEDREAAELLAAIPYDDGGVVVTQESSDIPTEMVFMDFGSFGYTGIAQYESMDKSWSLIEKEPLSPIFSSMIVGSHVDFKLLPYDKTERFPLRGSGKALRPVVETCRIAKRDAARAAKVAEQ